MSSRASDDQMVRKKVAVAENDSESAGHKGSRGLRMGATGLPLGNVPVLTLSPGGSSEARGGVVEDAAFYVPNYSAIAVPLRFKPVPSRSGKGLKRRRRRTQSCLGQGIRAV